MDTEGVTPNEFQMHRVFKIFSIIRHIFHQVLMVIFRPYIREVFHEKAPGTPCLILVAKPPSTDLPARLVPLGTGEMAVVS